MHSLPCQSVFPDLLHFVNLSSNLKRNLHHSTLLLCFFLNKIIMFILCFYSHYSSCLKYCATPLTTCGSPLSILCNHHLQTTNTVCPSTRWFSSGLCGPLTRMQAKGRGIRTDQCCQGPHHTAYLCHLLEYDLECISLLLLTSVSSSVQLREKWGLHFTGLF
jgi:hypothetical protein